MKNQSLLVIFLVVIVATFCHTLPRDNVEKIDEKQNEIERENDKLFKPDPKVPKALDPRFNKMLPLPKLNDNQIETATKAEKIQKGQKPLATEKSTAKDETSTIAFVPFKEDKLENELQKDAAHADVAKADEDEADPNYDEYSYDDDEQDDFSEEDLDGEATDGESKPIKTDKKLEDDDLTDDEYTDNDGEDDSDDEELEDMDMNKINNEMKLCPRDCICERNMHAYFVATCSRLDLETQSFANLLITDLQVIDIGPQFPIVLGVEFFKKIGLVNVTSIKIANSSIEYISPSAFTGLDELYSVNLTSIGIDLIHPDTFANNTKLKILTLSGNNLNVMQSLSSPYTDYMLKSPSIEELDISNCNMQEFLPTAFSQMKNIIFINLAGNKLTTLPQGLFDKTDTIEELDLSYNSIATLPRHLFNKTSLAMLHLKYNEIVSNLDFVPKDVQKLDLSYNKISEVNGIMFKGIENLGNLILKGNKIRRIHPAAFITIKNLRHIDLSFNDLEQISSLTFLKNPDLEVIRISDNIRLKMLPNEGFESVNKFFHVYLFDASNCDLSNLGENTFKTMPFMTRLNLAANNIENMPKNLFSPLVRLMELDLSSNNFATLDPQLLWNNQDLTKLNLNANPMESLSTKLFAPTPYLEELDISDCDLTSLWNDSSKKSRVGEFLKNLKIFNASNNDIKNIFFTDLSTMKNLKVFDLKNNPLECNEDFRALMKFLGTKKITLGNHQNHGEFDEMKATFFEEISPAIEWNDLARTICKRNAENKLSNQEVLEEFSGDDDDEEDYDDPEDSDEEDDSEDFDENAEMIPVDPKEKEKTSKKPVPSTKAPIQKSTAKPKATTSVPPSIVDSNNENDETESDDDYEDDDEVEDESIISSSNDKKNKNAFFDTVDIIKNVVDNGILGGEVEIPTSKKAESTTFKKADKSGRFDDTESNYDDETDEVIIAEANSTYRFLWPMLIVMLSIVVVLLVIMNVIALCMRRRGERYRQALLQSKNSIIYQKLSEEITPQTPKIHRYILVPEKATAQTPKAHRYTPIQQV